MSSFHGSLCCRSRVRAGSTPSSYNPSPNEVQSWQNSLRATAMVFREAELDDHGVILEYQLPLSSRRLDCIVTGHTRAAAPPTP